MFARRSFLQGAGLALLLTACGGSGSRSAARPRTVSGASPSLGTSAAAVGRSRTLTGYAFGATHQDVTLFDAGARQALRTQPLGATVTWLSNEQRFWDGHYIWTYDFPKNQVQAIAIDPQAVSVVRTIAAGGPGPAHSLMLTPDLKTAWVNIAGANELAMIDLASGQVSARVKTGAFP